MNMALYQRDFSSIGIKAPFDQMRANAMINAQHDTRGLSVLLFNINAFLMQGRRRDLVNILQLWAIEPIKRNKHKFKQHPQAGLRALQNRIQVLEDTLSGQPGIGYLFTKDAAADMNAAVEKQMYALCPELEGVQKQRA